MKIIRLFKDEKGQGLVEYSLIISLVILGAIVGLIAFGGGVSSLYYNKIVNELPF